MLIQQVIIKLSITQTLGSVQMNLCLEISVNDIKTDDQQIIKKPQPFKIKLLKIFGFQNLLLQNFILNKKKEIYTFPKKFYKIIQTKKAQIPLIYFPKVFPSCSSLLIYSHGNSSNLNSIYGFAERIYFLYNIAVIAYDYTGFGQSNKQQINFENDIRVVLSWAIQLGYDIKRIILAGFSIGAYPSLCIQGIMPRLLIAPISGLISFIQKQVSHYEGQPYDNIQLAKKNSSRFFMFHSISDQVSIQHSRILYKALTLGRTGQQINRVKYIELNQMNHEKTIQFLISQENRDFRRFLNEIVKQVGHIQLCSNTSKLIQNLIEIGKSIKVIT